MNAPDYKAERAHRLQIQRKRGDHVETWRAFNKRTGVVTMHDAMSFDPERWEWLGPKAPPTFLAPINQHLNTQAETLA